MPVITEERAGKVFMNIHKSIVAGLLILLACSPNLSDDPIPAATFPDEIVQINQYPKLSLTGGYIYLSKIGVRGVILYRQDATTFLAFEQNCSYRPNEACATVNVDISNLYMTDACCGSTFNFEGTPTGGPAWRPLRQYHTSLNGGSLTITDDIVE